MKRLAFVLGLAMVAALFALRPADTAPLNSVCTDTDSAAYPTISPRQPGTCFSQKNTKSDVCITGAFLYEYNCLRPSMKVCTPFPVMCGSYCKNLGAAAGSCSDGMCDCTFPEATETDADFSITCDAGGPLVVAGSGGPEISFVQDTPPLTQPNNYTCGPTSVAWILKVLNQTVPSVIRGFNDSKLIDNLSRHMNTTASGTGMRGFFFGLADFINGSGKNFTIKLFGNWTFNETTGRWNLDWSGDGRPDWWVRFPKNASTTTASGQNMSVSPVNQTFLNTIAREMESSEGVVIIYEWEGGVHAVAVHSIDDESFHLIKIMDPARGEVITAEVDGNMITYDTGNGLRTARIRFILSASPR